MESSELPLWKPYRKAKLMLSLCIAAVVLQAPTALDYFPLAKGTKWTYVDTGTTAITYTDEVSEITKILEEPAVCITTKIEGKPAGSAYYRSAGDTVFVVAYDPLNPIAAPHPVLKVADRLVAWEYKGAVPSGGQSLPLEFKATCKPVGERKVLERQVHCIEVHMDATVLEPGNVKVRMVQDIVYGKGIGMVEMRETTTIGKTKTERTVRLIRFEPGT